MSTDKAFVNNLLEVMCFRRDGYTTGLVKAALEYSGVIVAHSWMEAQGIKASYPKCRVVSMQGIHALRGVKGPVYCDREVLRRILIGYAESLRSLEELEKRLEKIKGILKEE